jgi:4-hydroxy-4-methyl-2-oxoglutarate aldolase
MKRTIIIAALTALIHVSAITPVVAQPGVFTRENLIRYTSEWKGERFPDGRPKVPDTLLERLKNASIEEPWAFLRNRHGYKYQFESGWQMVHQDVPFCGRAMTVQFMPARPDIDTAVNEEGKAANRHGGQYTWGVNELQPGDVYVADVYGKLIDSSHVGDNLGTTIWMKSGNGAIIDGTVRDQEGLEKIEGFNVYVREFNPESHRDMTIMGINGPVQIGPCTVMPGDVVLAKREGVIFIPPHLAEEAAVNAEQTRIRDTFTHEGVRLGMLTAQEADGAFMRKKELVGRFIKWLKDSKDTIGVYGPTVDAYVEHMQKQYDEME